MTFAEGLKALYPRPMGVSLNERLRGAVGGGLGIVLTALICLSLSRYWHLSPWLVAPVGASAVLVFAVPASPLAQPWSVVGGNTVSAIMGLFACNLIPDPVLAASLAVGCAIAAMFSLRCLHPPGGAMALLVVLTHTHSPLFALFPAFTNSLILVAMGLIYNNLTRKSYPHIATAAPQGRSGLIRMTETDFAAALATQDQVLDISAQDLSRLLQLSELQAYRRLSGHLLVKDIMSHPVHSVHFGTHLKEAWALLKRYDIKALPVVDRKMRLHGLLTINDFLRQAAEVDMQNPENGLKILLTPTGTTHASHPEVAGQIMSTAYEVIRENDPLEQLLPLFQMADKRHVLIVNDEKRLTGIVSSSDVMRALYHAAA